MSFVAVGLIYACNRLLKQNICNVDGRRVVYLLLVAIVGAGVDRDRCIQGPSGACAAAGHRGVRRCEAVYAAVRRESRMQDEFARSHPETRRVRLFSSRWRRLCPRAPSLRPWLPLLLECWCRSPECLLRPFLFGQNRFGPSSFSWRRTCFGTRVGVNASGAEGRSAESEPLATLISGGNRTGMTQVNFPVVSRKDRARSWA